MRRVYCQSPVQMSPGNHLMYREGRGAVFIVTHCPPIKAAWIWQCSSAPIKPTSDAACKKAGIPWRQNCHEHPRASAVQLSEDLWRHPPGKDGGRRKGTQWYDSGNWGPTHGHWSILPLLASRFKDGIVCQSFHLPVQDLDHDDDKVSHARFLQNYL